MLATVQTDEHGHFQISGNTANYQGLEANIDPYLKIYHKCGDGVKGFRRVTLRYPREQVSLGRTPMRTYNIGNLNLELEYPSEKHVDTIRRR